MRIHLSFKCYLFPGRLPNDGWDLCHSYEDVAELEMETDLITRAYVQNKLISIPDLLWFIEQLITGVGIIWSDPMKW